MDADRQCLIFHHVFVREFLTMLARVDNAYEDIQAVDSQSTEVAAELSN